MGSLFLAFTLIPLLELWLLVRIGGVLGPAPTLLFVIVMGAIGAVAARSQGRRVFAQWQDALRNGRVPEEGLLGSMMVLIGGILLITPGVITDLLGLLLLVPFTRRRFAAAVRRSIEQQVAQGRVRVYSNAGSAPRAHARRQAPTEVGRAAYRAGEVIDTDGEEV